MVRTFEVFMNCFKFEKILSQTLEDKYFSKSFIRSAVLMTRSKKNAYGWKYTCGGTLINSNTVVTGELGISNVYYRS